MLATPTIGPPLPMGDPLLEVRVLLPRPAGPPVLVLPKPEPLLLDPLVPDPLLPDGLLLLPNPEPVPPLLLPKLEPLLLPKLEPLLLPKLEPLLFPKLEPLLLPKLFPKLDEPVLLNPDPCCPVLPGVPVPLAPLAPATPSGWPKNPSGGTFASPTWMSRQSAFPVKGSV